MDDEPNPVPTLEEVYAFAEFAYRYLDRVDKSDFELMDNHTIRKAMGALLSISSECGGLMERDD